MRTKAFPKVLAIIEAILRSPVGSESAGDIEEHLCDFLKRLMERESENRYLISWLFYFLRANGLDGQLSTGHKLTDPIVRATCTSRFTVFKSSKDFKVFQGVKTSAKRITMLKHLDVFKPQ
jgi:hypothetical protein